MKEESKLMMTLTYKQGTRSAPDQILIRVIEEVNDLLHNKVSNNSTCIYFHVILPDIFGHTLWHVTFMTYWSNKRV